MGEHVSEPRVDGDHAADQATDGRVVGPQVDMRALSSELRELSVDDPPPDRWGGLLSRWARRDRSISGRLNRAVRLPVCRRIDYDVDPDELGAWATSSRAAFRHRLIEEGRERDLDAGLDVSLVAMHLYVGALQGWENSDNYETVSGFVASASNWLRDEGTRAGLVGDVLAMLSSIDAQMSAENARFCACPDSLAEEARRARHLLAAADLHGPYESEPVELLAALLAADRDHDISYYEGLVRVASVASTYVRGLAGELSGKSSPNDAGAVRACGAGGLEPWRAGARERIRAELPALRMAVESLLERGDVFGGELRSHCESLEALDASLDEDALLITHGRVLLLYPFSAELDAGSWSVGAPGAAACRRELMLENGSVEVAIDRPERTDAWKAVAGNGELAALSELSFADPWSARLVPAASAGASDSVHDLDLTVVLGVDGQHYIRVTSWVGRQVPGANGPWTGHDGDQWVRRLTTDAGAERVEVVSESADGSAAVIHFERLADLAGALAEAIVAADAGAASTVRHEPDGTAVPMGHEAIVFVAEDGQVVCPDGSRRPWGVAEDLTSLVGFGAFTRGHRYLSSAVEEWASFASRPPPDLLSDLTLPGDSLFVDGEVVALFARSSPNWKVIELIELIEFAVGAKSRLIRLTEALGAARAKELNRRPGDGESAKHLLGITREIDRASTALELLRARELVRSHFHRVFLDRLFEALGVDDVEDRALQSLGALEQVRSGLIGERQHEDSMHLDRRVEAFTAVALFLAIDQVVVGVGKTVTHEGPALELSALMVSLLFATVLIPVSRWWSSQVPAEEERNDA